MIMTVQNYRFHKFVNQPREAGREGKNTVCEPQLPVSVPHIDVPETTHAFKVLLKTGLRKATLAL